MTETYTYARFWRCALQVNPYKYSATHRGAEHGLSEDEYNRALLEQCRAHDIKVIGVADHGSVECVDRLRECLTPQGIVVFPGFEISSTEKVHMVCLFPETTTKDQLNRYLGKLDVTNIEEGTSPSKLSCLELAKRVQELGGFWYAAHVTGGNGLLRLNRDGGGLVHIWQDPSVRVGQIPGGVENLPESYRAIVTNSDPNYKRERPIVVINAKDVAKPDDLGDTAASTWVKMTTPTFDAFKVAFLDPGSRIRLSLGAKLSHSALVSLKIQGGYLDGVSVTLSEHLNAVIGGRGTGKSTLVECLRYVLDLSPKGKLAKKLHDDILRENLGKHSGTVELRLRSAAHHGKEFTVSRRYGEPPIVRDDARRVSQMLPRDLLPAIDFYGQNEIYELAQDAGSRVRLLERFLPIDGESTARRERLQKRLHDNQLALLKAIADRDDLDDQVALLPKLSEQLKGYESLGIESKLAKAGLYARERQLVDRVRQELARITEGLAALNDMAPDLAFLSDKALAGLPNAQLLLPLRESLGALGTSVREHAVALQERVTASKAELEAARSTWHAALKLGEAEVERAVAALPDTAGKSGPEVGTAYRRLLQELERIRPLEARKAAVSQLCSALEQERSELLAELSDVRTTRARALQRAVQSLNDRLRGKLKVELGIEGHRAPLKAFLMACKLEGVGEKRLSWIDEATALTPLGLARAIRGGRDQLVADYALTPSVAEALAKLPRAKLLDLEALELVDHVEIQLNVAHGAAEKYRSLEQLSTGQQCTAVLHMLLLQNQDPLVVDQPEDNLDNTFIAERIVRELRDAKARRQFLFCTHNANIPVFGDAEWIGILTSTGDHGTIGETDQGSIDVPHIREEAAQILEGGRAAFTQRKEMYEF